jgi:hypothetical protein
MVPEGLDVTVDAHLLAIDVREFPDWNHSSRCHLKRLEHPHDRTRHISAVGDSSTQAPGDRRTRPASQLLGQPPCVSVHGRQLLLTEFRPGIRPLGGCPRVHARRPLLESSAPPSASVRGDLACASFAAGLTTEFGPRVHPVQFGLARPNALFLGEGDAGDPVRARVRDPVRVVRIHLRLLLLVDRRFELRRFVDHFEAIVVDRLLVRFFERLFIDRHDRAAHLGI